MSGSNIINGLNLTHSRADDSWRMFKIMAETIEGFETLNSLPGCVSIFGSARAKPGTEAYEQTVTIASLLAQNGYGVITGGGPGLMEAANKGAWEANGESVGLHIHLPYEQKANDYLTTRCDFRYFFIRKFMFVKYALAYVVMPGGMGTMDEFSEAFVLAQTKRIKPFPIILYGKDFWGGLLDWIRNVMAREGYIDEAELDLVTLLDSPEDVLQFIKRHVIV